MTNAAEPDDLLTLAPVRRSVILIGYARVSTTGQNLDRQVEALEQAVVTDDLIRAARDMLPNPDHSVGSIARILGVSRGTPYNHIPDVQQLRSIAYTRALETGKS